MLCLLLSLPSPKATENSSASCFIYKFLRFVVLSVGVGGGTLVLWIFFFFLQKKEEQLLSKSHSNGLQLAGDHPALRKTEYRFLWCGSPTETNPPEPAAAASAQRGTPEKRASAAVRVMP